MRVKHPSPMDLLRTDVQFNCFSEFFFTVFRSNHCGSFKADATFDCSSSSSECARRARNMDVSSKPLGFTKKKDSKKEKTHTNQSRTRPRSKMAPCAYPYLCSQGEGRRRIQGSSDPGAGLRTGGEGW